MRDVVRYPGPSDLNTQLLTRNELGAMLEHILYKMGDAQSILAEQFPDAFQRLTGRSDETMAMVLLDQTAERRRLALEHLSKPLSPSFDCEHNEKVRTGQRAKLGAP